MAALCALACWVPAWLGADLLSTRYRRNPDPYRDWHSCEFLARATGRLGPYLAVQLVWAAVFSARTTFFGDDLADLQSMLADGEWSERLASWAAGIAAFTAISLPYFTGTAWLSSLARRPRPLVVTPLVAVFASLALVAPLAGTLDLLTIVQAWFPPESTGQMVFRFCEAPNLLAALWLSMKLSDLLEPQMGAALFGEASRLLVIGAFLALALPGFIGTWSVAARRYGRRAGTHLAR